MGLKFSGKALSFRDTTGIATLTSNRGPQHSAIEQRCEHCPFAYLLAAFTLTLSPAFAGLSLVQGDGSGWSELSYPFDGSRG
jgi:hypothetical protein